MYPFVRLFKEALVFRNAPALALGAPHVSHHICWPWDLDMWWELNNGRTLTLYDLGRIPLAMRAGLIPVMRARGWGLTVAGSSVRYRRRVRAFDKVEMHSRLVSWDAKFIYMEQSMWRRDGECTSHALFRTAVTDKNGIVPPAKVAEVLGHDPEPPEMPAWIQAWTEAEAQRPWPPEKG